MADPQILAEIINANDRSLKLVKEPNRRRGGYSFIFVAAIAPDAKDDDDGAPWAERNFDAEEPAREWIADTMKRRAQARRVKYAFSVTVYVPSSHRGSLKYADGILSGLNASDGDWRIAVGDLKSSYNAERIYRRMTPEHAAAAATLRTTINQAQVELTRIADRYALRLPGSGRGRVPVDRAIECDERMAGLFANEKGSSP